MTRRVLLRFALAAFVAIAVPLSSFAVYAQECPVEGSPKPGGKPLPVTKKALNRLKNRDTLPTNPEAMKVGDILALDDVRDPELEKKGVVLEGFLLGFKKEGPESPNCYSDQRFDFHMWIGAKRPGSAALGMEMRAQSVVVEPTPLAQDLHDTWDEEHFNDLIGERIRVTGWLMFDPEHPNQIGKTRGTLWEVHPVMKIEVFHNGEWVEF
jgi:hypothetical protein